LTDDLRASYQPGATWGEAFGKLMARLFEPWGVVLLDPLDRQVHLLGAGIYRRALENAAVLRRKLLERSRGLTKAGYHAQVHLSEDATLVFGTDGGNRVPVVERDGRFRLDEGGEIPAKDLIARVENEPLEFSANVLLRPVVQDSILPTLAYVAGPSELAYLGQAQVLYPEFGRPQPVLFPRAGFTLVERKVQRLLEKYRLEATDVWQGEQHLTLRITAAGFAEGWSERFDQSERELAAMLERLRKDIETLDPTLLDTLKHTEEKMKYHVERLRAKVSRSALQRSDLLARHAQTLLRFLFPAKDLQERQVCGLYFLGRAGYDLLDRLLAQIQTLSSDHQLVVY
jgi:bacillithiol biosynthesis cysteine-adding enzyme BshC